MLSDNFAEKMKECILQSSLQSLMELEAEMKGRIHLDGLKTDGSKIGNYSETFSIEIGGKYVKYKDYRQSTGRRVDTIDLVYDGNLKDSFTVGIVDDKYVLGFDSTEQFDLANEHTNHYGAIWKPNDEEKDFTRDTFKRIYRQCLEKSFKK